MNLQGAIPFATLLSDYCPVWYVRICHTCKVLFSASSIIRHNPFLDTDCLDLSSNQFLAFGLIANDDYELLYL